MNWTYKNIPKIAHFYWGKNAAMSFIQYLTIKTFKTHNPDWEVRLSIPKFPSLTTATWTSGEQQGVNLEFDFFYKVEKIVDTINKIDFDVLGFSNNVSEIHKSDFIRLHLLATEGGLWSDMDIFYLEPMASLKLPKNINLGVVYQDHNSIIYHLIGFMLASKSNEYYKHLLDNSLMYYKQDEYQSIGANLINNLLPTIKSIEKNFPNLNVCNLNMEIVYTYNHFNLDNLITENEMNLITNNTIGIHWFNGNPKVKNYIETINPYDVKTNTILGKLIKKHQL